MAAFPALCDPCRPVEVFSVTAADGTRSVSMRCPTCGQASFRQEWVDPADRDRRPETYARPAIEGTVRR